MTRSPKPCPICRKPRMAEHSPFCSTRCRDRDLLQWLQDGYALPGAAAHPDPDRDPDLGPDLRPDHNLVQDD